MPTPQEAARILKDALASGFDPVKGRLMREQQLEDVQHNRDLEGESKDNAFRADVSRRFQSPSDRRRDEMMGWGRSPVSVSGATASDERNAQEELDASPNFGVAARSRTASTDDALNEAAMVQRPEIGDASKTVSNRNAFAEFVKNRGAVSGKLAGEVAPDSVQALDAASKRRASELGVRWTSQGKGSSPISALRPGQDPLSGLSEQDIAEIKGLTRYELPVTGTQLRTPEWQDKVGRAMLVDPSFNASLYESRQKERNAMAAGKQGDSVQSLATVQDHLDSLKGKADALHNGRSPLLNSVYNWASKNLSGNTAVQGYEFDRDAVANELAASLKQSGATDSEINHWRDRLSASQNPAMFAETFKTAADLIQKRIGESGSRYDAAMGKPNAFREFMKGTESRAGRTATGQSGLPPGVTVREVPER